MRERNIGLVGMLSIVLFMVMLTASGAQHSVQTTAPSAAQQSVLTYTPSAGVPKVLISKFSQPLNLRRLDGSIPIAAPPPLTQVQRSVVINDVRKAVGISGTVAPNPPPQVILTADVPRVGSHWITVINGFNYPGGSDYIPAKHATIHGSNDDSWIVLHFAQLTVGKTYLVDITLDSYDKNKPEWILIGEVQGTMVPQSGHILVAFIANRSICEIALFKKMGGKGYLFGCEMTPLN